MSKSVIINLGHGDLNKGFPVVTVQLHEAGRKIAQFKGSLSPAPNLTDLYRKYQTNYISLSRRYDCSRSPSDDDDGFEIAKAGVTNVSDTAFSNSANQFKIALNNWLNSKGFAQIENQLRTPLHENDEILVVIETPDEDEILQRIPWHCWSFLEDYDRAEIALSRQEYGNNGLAKERENIRILAIVGDTEGIDVDKDRQFLSGLDNVRSEFMEKRSRQDLFDKLGYEVGWDILFFAGHSQTQNGTGIMYLLDERGKKYSLTVEQLNNALKQVKKRLKLAIFNSCDGLGLAFELAKLDIPHVIFMREPVPNQVAQEFFRYFLEAFAVKQLPLHLAVREARERLQGLEGDFPGASWLPVLYQNPTALPLEWKQLIPLSWFWEKLKQRANTSADWIEFSEPGIEHTLGWDISTNRRRSKSIQTTIEKDTAYSLQIKLTNAGHYLILLNQGLSLEGEWTRYLMCPSMLVAPNYRLSEKSMFLPQDGSMMEEDWIEFNAVGKEEFIGIVLDKPLNFPWVTTTEDEPFSIWDAQQIEQLWSYLEGLSNWQAFYRCFEIVEKT